MTQQFDASYTYLQCLPKTLRDSISSQIDGMPLDGLIHTTITIDIDDTPCHANCSSPITIKDYQSGAYISLYLTVAEVAEAINC